MNKWSNLSEKKNNKKHVKTHIIVVFKAFLQGFLLISKTGCNQLKPIAYKLDLFSCGPVQLRSFCGP